MPVLCLYCSVCEKLSWVQLYIYVRWRRHKESCSFLNAAMRTLQLHISELLLRLSLAFPPTLHESVCVCFCFKDNSSISITQPFLSGCGKFFFSPDLYDYRASCYINHREKQFLLQRKAILLFLFICHYIWTFLHYVHVAFTQDRKKKYPQT